MKYNAQGQKVLISSAGTKLFDASGAMRFTDSSASGAVKLYAADGSINVTILADENTYKGAYAPNGSLNVVVGAKNGWAPSGAMNSAGVYPQPFSYVQNFHKSNMQNWMNKYNAVLGATGRARVVFLGDSTTLGVGATSNTSNIQDTVRLHSMPAQLGDQLVTASIPANYDTSLGYQFSGISDPRLTLGAGWVGTGVASAGGAAIKATATGATSSWSFGSTTFDSVTFWYYGTGSTGVFEVLIDSVSQGSVVTNGAPTNKWKSVTYSTTLATHTLAVNWISGGEVDIMGPTIIKTGTPQIDIYNMGIGGSTTSTWDINNNWFPMTLSTALAGDLYVLNLGINDLVNAGITVAAYKSSMQDMITTLKATGANVIICVPTPCNSGLFTAGIQAYRSALQDLSSTNDIPLIDWFKFFNETYTASNYYFNGSANDALHPNQASYGLEATAMKTLLTTAYVL